MQLTVNPVRSPKPTAAPAPLHARTAERRRLEAIPSVRVRPGRA